MNSLRELQASLLAMILNPEEVQGEALSAIRENSKLAREERLAIYGEAFYGRLHQVMESEYPALHYALEADLFHYFVTEYLKHHPPSSYTLNDLGKDFPVFLRQTRPHDSEELWPEFIIELATLERAFHEVFNGSGCCEDEQSNDPELIRREDNSIELEFEFPVHEYFLATRCGISLDEIPAPKRTRVLVYRRNYQVKLMSE